MKAKPALLICVDPCPTCGQQFTCIDPCHPCSSAAKKSLRGKPSRHRAFAVAFEPPVRIVFLNSVGEFGGAERSLLSWIAATQIAFPQSSVTLIVPTEGALADRARAAGMAVEVLPLPASLAGLGDSALRRDAGRGRAGRLAAFAGRAGRSAPGLLAYVRNLRRLLKRLDPSVLHSNGIKTHLALRLAMWRRPARGRAWPPVVWHVHDFVGHRPLVAKALRRASSRVTAAIAVSNAVAVDAKRVLPGVAMHVVYNVVDPTRFSPGLVSESLLDDLAGMPRAEAGTIRVVLIGTFARWKGQDVLIDAAALIARNPAAPPVRFYIVGGPIYRTAGSQFSRDELASKADVAGVGDRVAFIGFQDDTAQVYRAADVVAHASTQPEPFGLTIVEAMACGRATMVARAGGAAELFTDGRDAIGVVPGDSQALADAILRLSADADLRRTLGEAARRAVVERFNPDGLPDQVRAIYAPLLNIATPLAK